jgi:hypothetical protein
MTPMSSRLVKTLASATMAASAVGLFAAPSQAAPVSPAYWKYGCDYGHACLRLARSGVPDDYWNVERCGDSGLHDYFDSTIAYGNGFTVYYQNGTWDYTAPWSQRRLDPHNLATMVRVHC